MHFECGSLFFHFECTSKVLSMSKTFRPVTRMCPNIWNAPGIQSEVLECTSIVKECTLNFHSDGIPAHSGTRVTRVLDRPDPLAIFVNEDWSETVEFCIARFCLR